MKNFATLNNNSKAKKPKLNKKTLLHRIVVNRQIYLMLIPVVLFYIIYQYVPMYGVMVTHLVFVSRQTVSQGSGYPFGLSRRRHEFDSRWDRNAEFVQWPRTTLKKLTCFQTNENVQQLIRLILSISSRKREFDSLTPRKLVASSNGRIT